MMPITMLKVGETNNIKNITGNDKTRRHLEHLGFIIGENVTVVSEIAGNLIVGVKNSRIALSKSMANRIMV
ncbi:Fe2+ transport system protein A [Clostridium pasteurianum DSM 525 = ATCC 6013]|uniref:Fe2+ transport system protein A n=1 Tax=Clostridium pasteurianum DSM 525 = ATCC 6013 TaxID=1262449 RepID=A0A0H3J1Q3_CLOPA|nr:FeoA family protein [Clostridium pasteurianum]AJA46632.1 Fe2+ transport system protein A [Clostridium pasteurianum DSM 525 = ATCC 6013]AJA50620.1 Fe2+ transport system protein A [Clostridium pasteurianum DSM 525 = ATCC 6013]AOZ74045.1 iron transporter FeoA [Clostridium pasteurianum DSM 525 = ATCC 6013]AOZ77842.1 iron transporter FeoA [Clostridium pasteurianum]KRU13368.1 FeoA family protein [Clostridium pasteurianum DSM 525 = ATCC 6013]